VSAASRLQPLPGRRHALGALALAATATGARVVAAGSATLGAIAATMAATDDRLEAPAWPRILLLDGTTIDPGTWHGQAIVLVVWATYCAFCRRHNPRIEALHRATRGRPLRVIGVALDRDPDLVRRHAIEHGYTFPISLDADPLRARLGLRRVIPTTVTFDRRGRLLQRIPGEMAEGDVSALARLADAPV